MEGYIILAKLGALLTFGELNCIIGFRSPRFSRYFVAPRGPYFGIKIITSFDMKQKMRSFKYCFIWIVFNLDKMKSRFIPITFGQWLIRFTLMIDKNDPYRNWSTSKLDHFENDLLRNWSTSFHLTISRQKLYDKPDLMLPNTSISIKLGKLPKWVLFSQSCLQSSKNRRL